MTTENNKTTKTRDVSESTVKRLVMLHGKYSFCLGLFWVWAALFMSEGRETAACIGAAAGWIGYALEENSRKT